MSADNDRALVLTPADETAAPLSNRLAVFVVAFVAAVALEKLIAIFATGFADDEAYTIVIARRLALSYFDHPPLHQWIVHAWGALFGEGRSVRLPFWAMLVALNLPLHRMTFRLFGPRAALLALLAFNASAYFLVQPDGYVMPDQPMLLALAFAGWGVTEIFFAPATGGALPRWLAVGAALGLAGLSKYAAVFMPLGLLGFLVTTPAQRRWLVDPRAYLGAALALALFSPALIWNVENHWVSFAFQSKRAAGGLDLSGSSLSAMAAAVGAQIALLSPWTALAVVMGIASAVRTGAPQHRLLLWLVLPAVLLFIGLPLIGQRAIPHWLNVGWLFAFPLAGDWLARRSETWVMRFAFASAALSGLAVAVYFAAVAFGLGWLGDKDPTRYAYDWRTIRDSALWRSGGAPDFVVAGNWRTAGRLGVALGPGVPICIFSDDPRGFAFECDSGAFVGKPAIVAVLQDRRAPPLSEFAPWFDGIGAPEDFAIGRGRAERTVRLARTGPLLRPYPLPYGPLR